MLEFEDLGLGPWEPWLAIFASLSLILKPATFLRSSTLSLVYLNILGISNLRVVGVVVGCNILGMSNVQRGRA